MKKISLLMLAAALCLALCACGHEHIWTQATCTQPPTCAECGETQGEALGHTWAEATCTKPRTCTVCGETQGEALGHTWMEANYQQSAACAVCGETDGEPLTPDFVTYGIAADMEVGVHYEYETTCYDSKKYKTTGDLVVLDYNIIPSDDDHEAKDGYEWRIATIQALFTDDNAYNHGYSTGTNREDYYNIRLSDDSVVYDGNGTGTFTVSYYGEEMECVCLIETVINEWQEEHLANYTIRVSFQVPVGYDGCVFGLRDAAVEWPDGAYIFDVYDDPGAYHLFRLS